MSVKINLPATSIFLGIVLLFFSCRIIKPTSIQTIKQDVYHDELTKVPEISSIGLNFLSSEPIQSKINNYLPETLLNSDGFQHGESCNLQWKYFAKKGTINTQFASNTISYQTVIPYYVHLRGTLAGCCSVQNDDCSYATDLCKGPGDFNVDGSASVFFDNGLKLKFTNYINQATAHGKCSFWINLKKNEFIPKMNNAFAQLENSINSYNYYNLFSELRGILNTPSGCNENEFCFNFNISSVNIPTTNLENKKPPLTNILVNSNFFATPGYKDKDAIETETELQINTPSLIPSNTIKCYIPTTNSIDKIQKLLNKSIKGNYKYGRFSIKNFNVTDINITGYNNDTLFLSLAFKGRFLKGMINIIAVIAYDNETEVAFLNNVFIDQNSLYDLKKDFTITTFQDICAKIKENLSIDFSKYIHTSVEKFQTRFSKLNNLENINVKYSVNLLPDYKVFFSNENLYLLKLMSSSVNIFITQ